MQREKKPTKEPPLAPKETQKCKSNVLQNSNPKLHLDKHKK